MRTVGSTERAGALRVFALVGSVVLAVNAATGGAAIAHRWSQASEVIDAVADVVSGAGRRAARPDDDEGDHCHTRVRVRREVLLPRTRVILRRRWTCRA